MEAPSTSKNVSNTLNTANENFHKEIPFTQEHINTQWNHFLSEIKKKAPIVFNAVKSITLTKAEENKNQIIINYSSDASLTKFKEKQPTFLKQFEQNNIELFFEKQTYIPKKLENPLNEFSKLKKENQLFQELDDFFNLEVKII